MRIAVLADTHNRYPDGLPERLSVADEIWHLGDVCLPGTLETFRHLGPPLCVVRGNNDAEDSWPESLTLERHGVRFHLVHIPPRRPPPGATVLLHGHTHVPRDETILGARWLNPGCITRPRGGSGPSFAWLTVSQGRPLPWDWVRL